MELTRYVEELKQQLLATADLGGEQARALADRLAPHLEGMVRLVLLDALSAAADEITTELAPGSVSVRLRGREPEFDVVTAPADVTSRDVTGTASGATRPDSAPGHGEPASEPDDSEISRITLRLPENLKVRVERAASRDRLSVNAWLVRAVAGAIDTGRRDPLQPETTFVGGQRLSGWVR
jgi:hypothetical protein